MAQAPLNSDSPIICPEQRVEQTWIDYNGHMNMAFYNLAFDRALDHVYDLLGIGAEHVAAGGGSCFTLETHVNYLQELLLGDPVRVEFQLLDRDAKRLHAFFELLDEAGNLLATSEQMLMGIDSEAGRPAPFPAPVEAAIVALPHVARDAWPALAGRTIGIRR